MKSVEQTERFWFEERVSGTLDKLIGSDTAPHLFAWLICGAVVGVTLIALWMSFNTGQPFAPQMSLANYVQVFTSESSAKEITNTLIVGVGTICITLFFGLPLAWLLNRTNTPLRAVSITMISITALIPGMVKAMGWILLLTPKVGLINVFLMNLFNLETAPFDINTLWGIAFVQGLSLTPLLFFLLAGPMRSLDQTLEEAAAVAGANRGKTLRRITAPVLAPAIWGGVIYVFITAISMFEIAALLGGFKKNPVLITRLFMLVAPEGGGMLPRYGLAGVYGVLIGIPSLISLYFYFRMIQQGHQYSVVTGKGYRPKDFDLGRFRYVGLSFVFLYMTLAVFLPLLLLLWVSLLPSLRMPSMEALSLVSFRRYRDIFVLMGGFDVIRNTVVLVVGATLLVLFFGFMVSWTVVRTNLRSRRALDSIAMLPHAIPGLGFAFSLLILGLLVARWLPMLPFYDTIWILIAANVLHRLSYVTRIMNSALIQIGHELEEAAKICGARKWASMCWVMMPLIRPALVFSGVWTSLLVFREVSMALMLGGADSRVLSTQIWTLWDSGQLSQAAAISVVLILILGFFLLMLQRVSVGRLDRIIHG